MVNFDHDGQEMPENVRRVRLPLNLVVGQDSYRRIDLGAASPLSGCRSVTCRSNTCSSFARRSLGVTFSPLSSQRAGLRRRRSRPRKCRVRGWGRFGERRSKRSTAHTFNRNENVPGQVAGRFSLPSIKAQSGFFQKLQMIQGVGNGFAFGVMVGVFPDCFKAHQNCCLGHLDAFEQARLVHFV